MKYIKNYQTISNATSDETVISPVVGYCHENNQVFCYNSGIVDQPLQITAQDGKISIQEKSAGPVVLSVTIKSNGYMDDKTIQYESGMTWGDFLNSTYNIDNYFDARRNYDDYSQSKQICHKGDPFQIVEQCQYNDETLVDIQTGILDNVISNTYVYNWELDD